MAETDTWMPLYVADYLGATQRLTCEQHGAYLLLIMDYWRNGPPPDDDDVLAQITRLDRPRWRKHRPALARLFQVENGTWKHKRIDAELERARGNVEKRREAGKAGAAKRWHDKGNSNRIANASETHSQTDRPSPSPSPSPEEKINTPPSVIDAAREPDAPAPHGALAFSGGVVRVNHREFEAWSKTYHGIPDLRATLASLDEWIVECAASDHTVQQRWRRMVTSRLDRKHQEWLAELRKSDSEDWGFTGPC